MLPAERLGNTNTVALPATVLPGAFREPTLGMIDRWMARAKAKGKLREVTLVVSAQVIDVLCKDHNRMFNYLEYKHGMSISLVEDEHAHINQFWFYDKNNEDITDLYKFV